MRRLFSWILAVILLLSVAAADGEDFSVVSCPEGGFSTLVDFACRTEFVEGDGLYFHLGEDNMPYVLASINRSDSRVTDPGTYLSDVLLPRIREANKDNGSFMSTLHGDGSLNGQNTPVLEIVYTSSQGLKIHFIAVFDVQPGYTAYYRVRYIEDADMIPTLSALETIAAYLKPDPQYYDGQNGSPDPTPQTGSGTLLSFQVADIVHDGMVMGRCTVPADWTIAPTVYCCTLEQSAGNPWLLGLTATSPEEDIQMSYVSCRDFYTESTTATEDDGKFSLYVYTPILHYMTASDYCDFWARMLNSASGLTLVDQNTFPELQPRLDQAAEAFRSIVNTSMAGSGLTADQTVYTIAQRRYALTAPNGVDYYFVISTCTRGTGYTATMTGPLVTSTGHYILWDAPYVYSLLCPADKWEQASALFSLFTENTSVSDQFLLANQRLSTEILSWLTGVDLVSGRNISVQIMRAETSKGNDYNDERYSDYMFDQNDYTLSDGTHVKVPTGYDYVYEGDNGNVYYSDSAFSQPGGSTQLYPNH